MHHNSIYSRIIAQAVPAPALDCRGRSLCNLHWLISEMSRLQLISRHLLSADLWQFMATAIAVNPLLAKCQLAAVARSFFAYFRTGHLCLWPKLYNWQPVCVFVCVCVRVFVRVCSRFPIHTLPTSAARKLVIVAIIYPHLLLLLLWQK